MSILYLLTILPPKMPQCEAISQEVAMLRRRFGGEVVYLNPNNRSPIYVPRALFGIHQIRLLRSRESDRHLHHLYNPDPFPFPILRALRRPIVYSLTGGIAKRQLNTSFFAALDVVTVADERSLSRLKSWGLDNAVLVRPGIDTSRFTCSPLPLQSEIRLMVGSAPWTRAQFRTKGIEALLQAAQHSPRLHLVFLWRGVLAEEMEHRVHRMNLEHQVTVLNKAVDVDRILASVHASITLAAAPDIVKSYPHSLLESLAAGKPVLVSRAIPMADYVEQKGCGKVVESISPTDILTAIEALTEAYGGLQKSAEQAGKSDFSKERLIASFREVYHRVSAGDISREWGCH